MIEAKILADSINCCGNRITSFLLTYPRFILAELNTHRMLSRSSVSVRALPIPKLIELVTTKTAKPIYWGKNQKGMQANEELTEDIICEVHGVWMSAMREAVKHAQQLLSLGVHKQIANRLLEPYMHATTIVTATEFGNFFNLRAHKDAQPEFQELAFQMMELYESNKPVEKKVGDWHLPFADKYIDNLDEKSLLKIVTARTARLSYMNFDGDFSLEKDFQLHDQLLESGHWSAFESAAQALDEPERSGNFIGWKSYRKFFPQENREKFDAKELIKQRGLKCKTK